MATLLCGISAGVATRVASSVRGRIWTGDRVGVWPATAMLGVSTRARVGLTNEAGDFIEPTPATRLGMPGPGGGLRRAPCTAGPYFG